jgi:hypothetical protein
MSKWPNQALQRTTRVRSCWQADAFGSPSLSLSR